jgi:hypothetical protein
MIFGSKAVIEAKPLSGCPVIRLSGYPGLCLKTLKLTGVLGQTEFLPQKSREHLSDQRVRSFFNESGYLRVYAE